MVYSEHFVGFWLSFTLPTICYLICPVVLWYFKKSYTLSPPTGSVLPKAWKLVRLAFKGRGSWNPNTFKKNMRDPKFWDVVKPSAIRARGETVPEWMNFDDEWVDEVRRGVVACKVFLWYPLCTYLRGVIWRSCCFHASVDAVCTVYSIVPNPRTI
jgi:POT family proton-dependent oligopeptide transporter